MRLFVSLAAVAFFAFFVLTACNSLEKVHTEAAKVHQGATADNSPAATSSPAAANTPGDGVRRITTVDLKSLMDKGEAVVIDVRADASWEAGHIKGSRHIPTDKILEEADKLPRDKTIVTYCS